MGDARCSGGGGGRSESEWQAEWQSMSSRRERCTLHSTLIHGGGDKYQAILFPFGVGLFFLLFSIFGLPFTPWRSPAGSCGTVFLRQLSEERAECVKYGLIGSVSRLKYQRDLVESTVVLRYRGCAK